jgi:hypothetical protein
MQNHKDLDQKIKTIGRHPIFKSNSRDELAPLARAAEWRGFRRGEMIFRQGDAPHHAHIVHTGRVKVFKTSVGGQAFITMIAGPHNTLNAVTCFGCKPRFFSAEALEDVRLVAIPTKPFVDFVFHHPVTAQAAGISTHPRSFGTFPWVLGHYCRDAGLISLEVAVHKMTGLAARYLGLKDRGLIREGLAADFANVRMRALDRAQAKWLELWGANAVIIPWAEIYNSLQTGVCDGYMNGAIVPIMFKHTDVLKYFAAANRGPSIRAVIASEEWYRGLAQKDRDVVETGVKAANQAVHDWANQSDKGALDQLRAVGLTVYVNIPAEREAFAKLIRPNYAEIVEPAVAELFLKLADAQR